MPGMIFHLVFAEEIYRRTKIKLNKVDFFSGNIIPDLVTAENKKYTHYRIKSYVDGHMFPDLAKARNELLDKSNSIKLGIFSHLYLDYYFIEEFLYNEFIFDTKNGKAINPRTNTTWDLKQFFAKSTEGGILYEGYTQINNLLFKDGYIKKETLDMLPDNLPLTGIPAFDKRYEMTWREELSIYLSENIPYTGKIFEYERIISTIYGIANGLITELENSIV